MVTAMKGLRIAITSLAAIATAQTFAWNGTGHMVIAEIALLRLTPTVRAECERLVRIGKTPMAYDFITASPWADDSRSERKETGAWHFINLHFRSDGKAVVNGPDPQNVVVAIERQSKILKDRTAPDLKRADALRYLIHFVGDLHQPLHATARDSEGHPKGDRGGNDFPLDGRSNLHSFYDRGAGLFPPLDRPLNALNRQLIEVQARTLMATVPVPSNSILDEAPMEWAMEGLTAAKSTVYKTPEGVAPSKAYIEKARSLCARKAAIAGYRLSNLINRLL